MPKTKTKKGKKVVRKEKGKGSGNVDVRVNVGTGREGTLNRLESAETRRIARALGLGMRGMPYNYANRRRNVLPPASGGGHGLAGSVQEIKTPNRTETFGATGFTPIDVRQREEREARSIFRPSPIPPLPPRPQRPAPRAPQGSAGRTSAGPAAPQGRGAAAEARAQDEQEPAVATPPRTTQSYGVSMFCNTKQLVVLAFGTPRVLMA